MKKFPLVIAIVHENLFEGEVESVTTPGSEGELTVLAEHEPFITTLKVGSIVVYEKKDTEPLVFEITHGILETADNRTTILI